MGFFLFACLPDISTSFHFKHFELFVLRLRAWPPAVTRRILFLSFLMLWNRNAMSRHNCGHMTGCLVGSLMVFFHAKWKCTLRTSAVMIARLDSARCIIIHYLLWEMRSLLLCARCDRARRMAMLQRAMTRRHLNLFFSPISLAWIMCICMFAH